jgi:hypothetical protein
MRDYSAIIDRRFFCRSIAGLAVNVVLAKLPSGIEQEFLIVNGWVLTREDMAASEVTPNVV